MQSGYYDSFDEFMHDMSHNQMFMRLVDLRKWIRDAVRLNYFFSNSREELKTSYQRYLKYQVFAPRQRFPFELMVSLETSEIGVAIASALCALDLPSKYVVVDFSHSPIDVWDAKRNFDNWLGKLMELTYCPDPTKYSERGIFSQTTFEGTYGLHWYEGC